MNMYSLLIGSASGLASVTTSDSFSVTLRGAVTARGEPSVTDSGLVFSFCP